VLPRSLEELVRLLAPALAAASLALAVPAHAAAKPAAPAPSVVIQPDPVIATSDFKWVFGIQINNPLDVGLYPDSVQGIAEDLDPGKTDGPRRQEIPLSYFRRFFTPLSAGTNQGLHYTGNAYFENARVTFTLFAHLADGKPMRIEKTFDVKPGPSSVSCPSEWLTTAAGRMEVVTMRRLKPDDGLRAPGILVVHGSGSHARRQLVFAREAAIAGYNVVMVSLPGYGQSEGQRDMMGPASYEAVEGGLRQLAAIPGVDTTHLAVWGVGEGAGLAARLASRHSELGAVVLQGGVYDLWAVARARGTNGPADVAKLAGRDSTAWRERSALFTATRIAAPVLLLHTARDASAPLAQARAYSEALLAAGTRAKLSEVTGSDLQRAVGGAADAGIDFLNQTFHMP
jgi:pimeloyl-ACP methyl ester carboxylesterase